MWKITKKPGLLKVKTLILLNKLMSVKKFFILHVLYLLTLGTFAQTKVTVSEYIRRYQNVALEEMRKYKIPASITLAQGILESANGNSELARNANNHFGIKCKTEWTGDKYYYDDDAENECFRKYKRDMDSYRDHSVFLTTRKYYVSLFKLDIMDYKGWAYGLKAAGYATEPLYAEMLIKIIEENHLHSLDSGVIIVAPDSLAMRDINQPAREVSRKPDSIHRTAKIGNGVNASEFPDINIDNGTRKVLVKNGVKYIIADKKDTYTSIADYFGLAAFDLLRYNDAKTGKSLSPGDIVYLESKRKTSAEDFHIAASGETMRGISQNYAVQLKELYRKNRMKQGSEPKIGQKIWLKNAMPVY